MANEMILNDPRGLVSAKPEDINEANKQAVAMIAEMERQCEELNYFEKNLNRMSELADSYKAKAKRVRMVMDVLGGKL